MGALTGAATRKFTTKGLDSLRPRRLLTAAWIATLLATASYLALILQVGLKGVAVGLFVAASVAVVAYWFPGEPMWKADKLDALMDPLVEPPTQGNA